MRKKLDTRFPAARIKKIIQADEDIGKIAMAVPLLVSKALELFLQDLCDRTYGITLRRGAKTMNSFHLKQCVQTFNDFDFLKDIVSKVPDLGGHVVSGDDRIVCKRRKVGDDGNDSDDVPKRNKTPEYEHHTGGRGRGQGRGRGRGRGRGSRTMVDREIAGLNVKSEDDHRHCPNGLKQNGMPTNSCESMENGIEHEEEKSHSSKTSGGYVRNFDLNMDPVEDEDSPTELKHGGKNETMIESELMHEEFPGWSLSEIEKMAIDPMQLVNLNGKIDEEDEDYDEDY